MMYTKAQLSVSMDIQPSVHILDQGCRSFLGGGGGGGGGGEGGGGERLFGCGSEGSIVETGSPLNEDTITYS